MSNMPWLEAYPEGLSPRIEITDEAIWDAICAAAKRFPNRPALTFGARTHSYRQLCQIVEELAEIIAEDCDFPPRVLLFGANSDEFVFGFLAASLVGVVSAPSLALSAEELGAQIRDFAPDILLAPFNEDDAYPSPEEAGVARVILFKVEKALAHAAFDVESPKRREIAHPNEVAVVQYTSGTTGVAKGAMMSDSNLVTNARQNAGWFGWTEKDVNIWLLPLCHTWGVSCGILSTLITGAHLVVAAPQRIDAKSAGSLFRRHRGTILYASATLLYRLLDDPFIIKEEFSSLRIVKAGAMLTQGNLKERWDGVFPHAPLQQGYGLTEASPETHNNPPQRYKAGTVGVPIQSTECRIVALDDPRKVLEVGAEGEVAIRGPQVFVGYWGKPELSAETLVDGWLLTGDIGKMDAEGYLTIVDRKKDLLKFRGYSIAPSAIEKVLRQHPQIADALVVGRPNERDGEIPVAAIVVSGAEAPSEAALREYCALYLARYEIPREFVFLEAIPKNQVGKPLRRVVRELVLNASSEDGRRG